MTPEQIAKLDRDNLGVLLDLIEQDRPMEVIQRSAVRGPCGVEVYEAILEGRLDRAAAMVRAQLGQMP